MIGLGKNFDIILDQVDRVRRKDLLYTVFRFQKDNSDMYEIKASIDHPNRESKFTIRSEEEQERHFNAFKAQVSPSECSYALFDFETVLEDGSARSMLFLLIVVPDECAVKEKFLYSAHTQHLVDSLRIAVTLVQINKFEDFSYAYLKQKCLALKKA